MGGTRGLRLGVAIGTGIALVGLAIGVAIASIPTNGVINGCYGKVGGVLRVIDPATQKCNLTFEKPIFWSQTGPPGADGAPGANGAPGADGAPGTPGISGYEMVKESGVSTSPSGGPTKAFVNAVLCPVGKSVVGGGGTGSFFVTNAGGVPEITGPADMTNSAPLGVGIGWQVGFAKLDGSTFAAGEGVGWELYAICVTS
jgi:hypothetical protein